MKVFWHFFRSNLKYNKIELAISYCVSMVVFIVFNYLKDPKDPEGDILFSVAFYAMLYAFYSNKKKYNLKYMLSLPLSKSQLLATKVASDLVFFLPAIFLAFWGGIYTKLGVDAIPLLVLLIEAVFFVSFIMFDSDIEQPRLENAKSSFLNRLIYVRKMADFFFLAVFVIYIALAVNLSPMSMFIKQYILILLLAVVLFFKFNRSLKLMKDESMSYFMPKRDLFRIGWKVAIFAIPAVVMLMSGYKLPSKYGREEVFSMIERNKLDGFAEKVKRMPSSLKGKSGYTPVQAAIESGNVDALEILLENEHNIDWDSELKVKKIEGIRPIHLAVRSGELKMVEKLLELKPDEIHDLTNENKSSLLQLSAYYCVPELTEFFLKKKLDVNYKDKRGNTALIVATIGNCMSAATLLLEHGANPNIKNQDKKTAYSYAHANWKYIFRRKGKNFGRLPASATSDKTTSLKAAPLKPLLPALLRRQK